MADPHRKLLQLISSLNEERSGSFSGTGKTPPYYQFFLDKNGTAKPIDEVLEIDYSREDLARGLPDSMTGQFGAWIPPNIALSCLLAFERDIRSMRKTRLEAYTRTSAARAKQKTLLDNYVKSIDTLEGSLA